MKFVQDWKTLIDLTKTNPQARVNMVMWDHWHMPAEQARNRLLHLLHRKISRNDPRNVDYWQSRQEREERNLPINSWLPEAWQRGKIVIVDSRTGLRFKKYADENYLGDYTADRTDLERIRTSRIRIYQFRTEYYRRRFGHLLARYDD